MQVSFIIPLYNCLPLTQAMLASLQATLPAGLDHEIIFVDDGSTDGTREWLSTLKAPVRIFLNERNLGYAAANNLGADAARGDILALLNNDLILTPGWLEPLLEAQSKLGERAGHIGNVQRDALTGAVDHTGIFINLKGKPEHDRLLPPRNSRHFTALREVDALTGACMTVRRALWRELGGFDMRYVNGCEDIDLCLRARAAGKTNAVSLVSVIRHAISATAGRKRHDERNTYRLTLRWRSELPALAMRHWYRRCAETWWHDPAGMPDPTGNPDLVPDVVARLRSRVSGRPAAPALEGINAAIELELARWRAMHVN